MSVVAARVYEDRVEIASDSIKVRWCTQQVNNSKLSKLWESGELIIGGVGSCEEIALMRLFSLNHAPESDDDRGIVAFMGEFALWKKIRTDSAKIENSYLIVYRGRMFHVEGLFVEEITSYEAIGAGMDYALAAMCCGHDPKTAVETAIELSILCAAPVNLMRRRR